MEHTHLVKGLDYALLNKVRSEIVKKPDAVDDVDGKSRYFRIRIVSDCSYVVVPLWIK